MARALKPNTLPGSRAAQRLALERRAEHLRDRGWEVKDPDETARHNAAVDWAVYRVLDDRQRIAFHALTAGIISADEADTMTVEQIDARQTEKRQTESEKA